MDIFGEFPYISRVNAAHVWCGGGDISGCHPRPTGVRCELGSVGLIHDHVTMARHQPVQRKQPFTTNYITSFLVSKLPPLARGPGNEATVHRATPLPRPPQSAVEAGIAVLVAVQRLISSVVSIQSLQQQGGEGWRETAVAECILSFTSTGTTTQHINSSFVHVT